MILPFLDCWKSLSGRHWLAVAFTIVLPVGVPTFLRHVLVESRLFLFVVDSVTILLWFLIVVVAVALLVRRDSAAARQLVESRVDPLEGQLNDLDRSARTAQTGIDELEQRVREAIEDLGGKLSPRVSQASVHLRSGAPRVRARGTSSPPPILRARLMWWFGRVRCAVCEAVRWAIWDFRRDRESD